MLAGGLFYARGVVLAPAQRFVLVVETMTVSFLNYWLKNPKVKSDFVLWVVTALCWAQQNSANLAQRQNTATLLANTSK